MTANAKNSTMTVEEVMTSLEEWGDEGIKKIYVRHGAREPFFGVKVADLKKIVKAVKKDHQLSLDLFKTGNSDAMYLAGLIADETQITKEELQEWANGAYWYFISEYTVPWITSESPYALELGLKWMDDEEETIATCGWSTISSYLAITPNSELDMTLLSNLLDRVEKTIDSSKNRVRYVMNGYVIAVGGYIEPLSQKAIDIGKRIGKVNVEMGGTACKVPFAPEYIPKMLKRGTLQKKRIGAGARC
jgi:3-methyladenine DNA glycosylase AlkD